MKTAKFIKQAPGSWNGDARLFSLDPPMKGEEGEDIPFVIVSGVDAMGSGDETYIFPADEEGNCLDWGELPGSFRGSIDHAQALENAGYQLV